MVLVFAAAVGNAWGDEVPIDWTYSGSWTDTVVDRNLDGTTANEFHIWTKGGPGRAALNGIFEVIVLGPTDECPYPLLGTELIYSIWVGRFDNGDLLFARSAGDSAGCIDPVTGTASGRLEYEIIGGTGKYRGATGSYVDHITHIYLLTNLDPLNPISFAASFGHAEGTIYTVDD
jgi:hypothetical protein